MELSPLYLEVAEPYILEEHEFEIQCDATTHESPRDLPHGGPATHFMITPCGHGNGFRCLPFVQEWTTNERPFARCEMCDRRNTPKADYRFIPLDVTS